MQLSTHNSEHLKLGASFLYWLPKRFILVKRKNRKICFICTCLEAFEPDSTATKSLPKECKHAENTARTSSTTISDRHSTRIPYHKHCTCLPRYKKQNDQQVCPPGFGHDHHVA